MQRRVYPWEIMPKQMLSGKVGQLLHDMSQPLSTISLTATNIRNRCSSDLELDKAAYLQTKLERIEQQVQRIAALMDELDDLFQTVC